MVKCVTVNTINYLSDGLRGGYMAQGRTDTEHIAIAIKSVFDVLLKRFFLADKNNADMTELSKITSQIGYMAQTHTGIRKNLYVEKEINDLRDIVMRIPPEVLAEVTSPLALETNALR